LYYSAGGDHDTNLRGANARTIRTDFGVDFKIEGVTDKISSKNF
jgi:hypothetical protein